jgi:hypothetical protein
MGRPIRTRFNDVVTDVKSMSFRRADEVS